MSTTEHQREQQLVISAAFFRRLLDEDASGVDLGLAQQLMAALVGGGERPEWLQYSCRFGPGTRAAGRWLYGFGAAQVADKGVALDPIELLGRLLRIADFATEARGARAFGASAARGSIRALGVGFDAHPVPEDSRVRLSALLASGEEGRPLVDGVCRELGLAPQRALVGGRVGSELALDYGPRGLDDVRFSYPVAPQSLVADPQLAADGTFRALLDRARTVEVVRSIRALSVVRVVFTYGAGAAAEAAITTLSRRSAQAAEFRRSVARANRGLPGKTGIVMQPWGVTLALGENGPDPERFSVLLRPLPLSLA